MTSETKKEPWARHKKLEKNVALLGVLAFAAVTVGGIIEIAPLLYRRSTEVFCNARLKESISVKNILVSGDFLYSNLLSEIKNITRLKS